jgi:hypothetical protein
VQRSRAVCADDQRLLCVVVMLSVFRAGRDALGSNAARLCASAANQSVCDRCKLCADHVMMLRCISRSSCYVASMSLLPESCNRACKLLENAEELICQSQAYLQRSFQQSYENTHLLGRAHGTKALTSCRHAAATQHNATSTFILCFA